ncbi:MAG: diacylglycerol kinase family lipid kinase [Planctomycetaceae bacterium]|nr:diacylglycerol kinase family lipid kinase [Planctomycetales bacterium]MCB9922952.1 diacylglycerol kinase family lipid kinase [Planctomycetaceae bacterium]
MKRSCLILNKSAGQATGIRERLTPLLIGRNCHIHDKRDGEAVESQARRAVNEGFERIIVAGGDGTLNRVVNGIGADLAQVECGLIPLGTGNDFARSLSLPLDDLQSAVAIALGDRVVPVDLIQVTDKRTYYAVNAVSGGMAGKVAADVLDTDKAKWGAFAYWITAFSELIDMTASSLHIDIDDRSCDLQVYGVIIANGRYVGGGFPIAPSATLMDGKLAVVVVPVLPALELMSAGLNYALGIGQPESIKMFEAKRVHVSTTPELHFSIDGEPTRELEATFEVVPRAIRVAVGPALTASP